MSDSVRTSGPAEASAASRRFFSFEIAEVWVRFLLANLGLALAFGAALFSTVARESGHLWTTLILACVALSLAVIVGLTTVPYLARRVAGERVRDAFDYDVTRVGILYVLTVVLIGIAALNTGNNLLYVIVAAMLGAILVSGAASAVVLRKLELDVAVPERVFALRPVPAKIVLRNRRRWLPSFSISVVPLRKEKGARWRWVEATFGFPPFRPAARQWLILPDRKLRRVMEKPGPPGIFSDPAYFPYIAPLAELAAELELCFPRRGRYRQDSFGLATRFPFAFLTKTRRVSLAREVLVYPKIEEPERLADVLPLIAGELETFARGRGDDLYRIREYLPEDSARHVDWKATAKSGSLKVREYSREDRRKLRLVFDNPAPGMVSSEAYERAVTLAASLAWHLVEAGTAISFAAPGCEAGADIFGFLAYLATVSPQRSASGLAQLASSEDYNVIVTAQEREAIPAGLWAGSHVVFMAGRD